MTDWGPHNLDWRELKCLRRFVGNHIEPKGAFGRGVGPKTLNGLEAKGLIEYVVDRERNEEGYRITEAGENACF